MAISELMEVKKVLEAQQRSAETGETSMSHRRTPSWIRGYKYGLEMGINIINKHIEQYDKDMDSYYKSGGFDVQS